MISRLFINKMNHSLRLFTIVLFFSFAGPSSAQTTFVVAPTYHYFHYTEFDATNQELNRERGWMRGLVLGLSMDFTEVISVSIHQAHLKNDVAYIGYTNKGNYVSTRTDEQIKYLAARLNLRLLNRSNMQLHSFIALRQHEWQRGIRAKAGVAGLFEMYEWLETAAGLRWVIKTSSTWGGVVEASMLHTGLFDRYAPSIYVDLAELNAGAASLTMEPKLGSRFSIAVNKHLNPRLSFGIKAYYESWDFGRSNAALSKGGAQMLLVTEPRSETRSYGVQVMLTRSFD